ncbi:PEP-CTERM sorting domain-containing protein, partial [Leptolyngbyaceae cyanobacterium UHCC 1019]
PAIVRLSTLYPSVYLICNYSNLIWYNFIATLFAECGNDGMAIESAAVPEPTTMAGLALAGSGLTLLRRRRRSLQ